MAAFLNDSTIELIDGSRISLNTVKKNDLVKSCNNVNKINDYIISATKGKNSSYVKWNFENVTLKSPYPISVYCVEDQKMKCMEDWKIGEHCICRNKQVAYIGKEEIEEECDYVAIETKSSMYMINGILCGNKYRRATL